MEWHLNTYQKALWVLYYMQHLLWTPVPYSDKSIIISLQIWLSFQNSPKVFNFASVLILVSWIEKLMLHIRNGRAMKSTQKDEPTENYSGSTYRSSIALIGSDTTAPRNPQSGFFSAPETAPAISPRPWRIFNFLMQILVPLLKSYSNTALIHPKRERKNSTKNNF